MAIIETRKYEGGFIEINGKKIPVKSFELDYPEKENIEGSIKGVTAVEGTFSCELNRWDLLKLISFYYKKSLWKLRIKYLFHLIKDFFKRNWR